MANNKSKNQAKALKEIAGLMPIKRMFKDDTGAVLETLPLNFAKLYSLTLANDITSILKGNTSRCSVQLFAMSAPKSEDAMREMADTYHIDNMPTTLYETAYYAVLSIKAPQTEALKELKAAEDAIREFVTPLDVHAAINLLHATYHPCQNSVAGEANYSAKAGVTNLIELIAPDSLSCKLKEVTINGMNTETILLIDYSSQLDPNFYMDITTTNCPFYMASHYAPIDADGIIGWLENKIQADDAAVPSTVKNPKGKKTKAPARLLTAEKRNNYELMLKKLRAAKAANERVYSVSTYITVFGSDKEATEDNVRLIKEKSKRYYINFISAQSQHKQSFNASLPLGVNKCEISSTMYADDYCKLVPSGFIRDIFSTGTYYATDVENKTPVLVNRTMLNTKNGFVFGTAESQKEKLMMREIESLRGADKTAVIVLDIDNNMEVEGEQRDVTQLPLFPTGEEYSLKCTLLGNIVRALINKKAGLLKDESEVLNCIFGELASQERYTFAAFLEKCASNEVMNKKITSLLQDIPANCMDTFVPSPAEQFIVYKFDKVVSHNPLFSNRDIYGLFALSAAYEQALFNQTRGIKTYIYVNGFDAGILHVKNAKYLATILNKENERIIFTLATENAGLIIDGIKRNVKTDVIEMNLLVSTIVASEFIAIYNISPSYRQTIWTLLNLHPQFMQSIVPEQNAGIICTPYKVIPFEF